MKHLRIVLVVLVLMSMTLSAFSQVRLPRPSPKASVSQTIGVTDVTISYSRPGVKGRTIWGELVPWDKVWRTGANEATTISFSSDVKIEGQPLTAGSYSVHSIPGKDEWTVIFNKVADQWGSYSYDVTKDALRVKVQPQSGELKELVTFSFPVVSADAATLQLAWERVRVPLTIAVDTKANAMAGIRASVAKAAADDWRTRVQAAQYAFESGADSEQAAKWLDESIGIAPNFRNMTLRAEMLAKKGDSKGAIAAAEKAVALGKASKEPVDTSRTEELIAKWKKK